MTHSIYNAGDDPADVLKLTCIDHPEFEGSRQSKAYLAGCIGCRAVYAVRKAQEKNAPGRPVPVLRLEIVEHIFRRFK